MYINYFQCAISLNLVDIHEFFYTPRKKKKQKNKEIYMGNFINNAPFALVIVFLIIGFVLLIKGADFFVEGSSSVAKRLHVPSIIIGLTIVAMGTSLPETAVSVSASITGNNELAVSNVVGSNIFNLMVVWTLTGMWHGAAWNFVAWGVYYGVILVMEKYVWGASVEQLPKPVQHIYAGAVILVGWVFFFSPSLGYALRYLWAMIGGGSGIADAQGAFLLFTHWLLFVIAAVGSTAYGRKLLNNAVRFSANRTVRMTVGAVLYIGIFFLSVAFLVTDTFNPFLYFRF